MKILRLKAGSSRLKSARVDVTRPERIARGIADGAGQTTNDTFVAPDGTSSTITLDGFGHVDTVRRFMSGLASLSPTAMPHRIDWVGVGQRVIQEGEFKSSVRIMTEFRARSESLVELAPLHNRLCREALALEHTIHPGRLPPLFAANELS